MNKNEMFGGFDITEIEKHKEKYAEEVRQKYGHTEAYKESEKKTSEYTKADWASIMTRWDNIFRNIASNMDKGPNSLEVQKMIGELRQHITDNFYNCTIEIFRGLGDLYVNDQRFTENIDKYGSGLAQFLKNAIHIYCDNN